MPVTSRFSVRLSIKDIVPIMNSLGAHVAAKLGHFATDERTLTDDLCDMFYTWSQSIAGVPFAQYASRIPVAEQSLINALPGREFDVEISKTTQQEEAVVGSDLVGTNYGVNLCL